jgi:hypothetical protein
VQSAGDDQNPADQKRPNVLVNEGVSLEGAYRAKAN